MDDAESRIYFVDSPWPGGHRIERFEWWAHIDAREQLRLMLELVSARYDAESEGEPRSDSDWGSPDAWCNYHACTLRPNRGLLAGTKKKPFDWRELDGATFTADARTRPHDDRAFHIYLLGHDGVRDHRVELSAHGERYALHWTGRVALEYAGETRYKYEFDARVTPQARFAAITFHEQFEAQWARQTLRKVLIDERSFELGTFHGRSAWVAS